MYLLCCSKLPIIVSTARHCSFRFIISREASSSVWGTSTSSNQLRFSRMSRQVGSEGWSRRQSQRQGAKGSILKLQSGCWLNLATKGKYWLKLSSSMLGQLRSNSSLSCLRASSSILSRFSLKILLRLDLRASFCRLSLSVLNLVYRRISLQQEPIILIVSMQPTPPSAVTPAPSQSADKPTANSIWSESGNPESNPRRAATRLKEKQLQVEMMRNRFKVIEGHDQYLKYRTLDQQRRIDNHNSVHSRIARDKQELRLSLAEVYETSQIMKRNKELRQSIREGVREARKSLQSNRHERSQLISEELKEYEKKIEAIRKEDLETNRERSSEVKREEEAKREKVRKHQQYKIINAILNKSKDSRVLDKEAQHLENQYQVMMELEKHMLEENNRSLQASQAVRGRYQALMTGQGSPRLPRLDKDRKAATTANSELLQ